MIYLYDGTFPGLLTTLHRIFSSSGEPRAITTPERAPQELFARMEEVETDPELARRFLAAVERKTSRETVRTVHHAFLSEEPGIGLLLYRYLRHGRVLGNRLDRDLAHPVVREVHRWAQRVRREAHRMKGFIRFRELSDGLFYASIEPDFDILSLVEGHFAGRFAGHRWLIHDLKRKKGILSDGKGVLSGEIVLEGAAEFSESEPFWQDLWRRFFAEVAIPERKNLRLQQQHVPKKYRKNLTEMGKDGSS